MYTRWMKPIQVPVLTVEQRAELESLYRKTKLPRVRTRAQMVLLAADQGLSAPAIAVIVRESADTVGRWLKRYVAEGVQGLMDAPHSGRPSLITEAYRTVLLSAVRRRPRSLNLPFSLWTLQRLVDYLAEQTGTRIALTTMHRLLKKEGIVLSRPQHKISSPDPEYLLKKRRLKKPVTT
jgi:transposase